MSILNDIRSTLRGGGRCSVHQRNIISTLEYTIIHVCVYVCVCVCVWGVLIITIYYDIKISRQS